MSRIVKQIINTQVLKIITFVSQMIFFIIISKNIEPEKLGIYYLIGTILTVGTYVFGLELYSYVRRIAPGKTPLECMAIFKTTLLFELSALVLTLTLIFLLRGDILLARLLNASESLLVIRLGLILLIPQLLSMEIIRYLVTIKEIEIANTLSFLKACGWIYLVMLFWVFTGEIKLWILIAVWMAGFSLVTVYCIVKIGVKGLIQSRYEGTLISEGLKFSLPLLMGSIGEVMIIVADRLILSYFYSPKQVALYSVAYRFGDMSYMFSSATVLMVMWPYAIEAYNVSDMPKTICYMSNMVKYSLLPLFFLIAVGINNRVELIQVFTRNEYLISSGIIPLLILIPIVRVLIYPAYYSNYLRNKTKSISCIYLVGLLINIFLNLILIPKYSIYGASLATLVTFVLIAIFMYLISKKQCYFDLATSKLIQLVAVFLITCMAIWLLRRIELIYSLKPLIMLVVSTLCGAIIYVSLLFLYKVFDHKEKSIFLSFLTRNKVMAFLLHRLQTLGFFI